jgi:hypothetical protein
VTGGNWKVQPAGAAWSVNGSSGRIVGVKGQWLLAGVAPLLTTDADFQVTFTSTAAAGALPKWLFIPRNVNGSHQYQVKVRVTGTKAILVSLNQLLPGVSTRLGPEVTLAGLTWTPGMLLRVRTQTVGTSPTIFRVKVWPAGAVEPTAWNVEQNDSEASLQVGGSFGLGVMTAGGATGSSATYTFDDFSVTATS